MPIPHTAPTSPQRKVGALMRFSGQRRPRTRGDAGADMIFTVIFVLPIMFVLALFTVDVGMMFANRFAVTNIINDAVRTAQVNGGNGPFAWQPPDTLSASQRAEQRLNNGNTCAYGPCTREYLPVTVECGRADEAGNIYPLENARYIGDWVGCRITNTVNGFSYPVYPYHGVTGGLLNTPFAMGLGGIVAPFPVSAFGQSETGQAQGVE